MVADRGRLVSYGLGFRVTNIRSYEHPEKGIPTRRNALYGLRFYAIQGLSSMGRLAERSATKASGVVSTVSRPSAFEFRIRV